MREIKFRAWDKQRKEMILVEEIHFKYNSIVYNEGIITSPMKNFEMMQFTGLKDKNGKEIYEGDIVKWYNGVDEVKYSSGCFYYGVYSMNEHELKVIGNIYENPEFLKSGERVK